MVKPWTCFMVYSVSFICTEVRITQKMEKKGKTLIEKWRDLRRKGTHKYMETYLIYFNDHQCLSQSEEGKCMWTHSEDAPCESFWQVPPERLWDRKGGGSTSVLSFLHGLYSTHTDVYLLILKRRIIAYPGLETQFLALCAN